LYEDSEGGAMNSARFLSAVEIDCCGERIRVFFLNVSVENKLYSSHVVKQPLSQPDTPMNRHSGAAGVTFKESACEGFSMLCPWVACDFSFHILTSALLILEMF